MHCVLPLLENLLKHLPDELKFDFQLIKKVLNKTVTIPDLEFEYGTLKNITVYGLDKIDLTNFTFAVTDLKAFLEVRIPLIRIQADYELDWGFYFVKMKGKGKFEMSLDDVSCKMLMTISAKDEYLEISQYNLEMDHSNMYINFENLMNGGIVGAAINGLLNMTSSIVFEYIKSLFGAELEKIMNDSLMRICKIINVNNKRDVLVFIHEAIIDKIKHENLDPLKLIDIKKDSHLGLSWLLLSSNFRMFNGYVVGLSSIDKSSTVQILYRDCGIMLKLGVALPRIEVCYEWCGQIFDPKVTGNTKIVFEKIQCYIELIIRLENGKIDYEMTHFKIQPEGEIWVDNIGLGSLDILVQAVINLFLKILKPTLVSLASAQIKQSLEQEMLQLLKNILSLDD